MVALLGDAKEESETEAVGEAGAWGCSVMVLLSDSLFICSFGAPGASVRDDFLAASSSRKNLQYGQGRKSHRAARKECCWKKEK